MVDMVDLVELHDLNWEQTLWTDRDGQKTLTLSTTAHGAADSGSANEVKLTGVKHYS